jgi:uncharacterized protein YjbJ (UPF0337 family)
MNTDILGGMWKQIQGEIKQQWGKLTDDDITVINGQQDKLVGKVQERYGYARDEAEREVDQFLRRYSTTTR